MLLHKTGFCGSRAPRVPVFIEYDSEYGTSMIDDQHARGMRMPDRSANLKDANEMLTTTLYQYSSLPAPKTLLSSPSPMQPAVVPPQPATGNIAPVQTFIDCNPDKTCGNWEVGSEPTSKGGSWQRTRVSCSKPCACSQREFVPGHPGVAEPRPARVASSQAGRLSHPPAALSRSAPAGCAPQSTVPATRICAFKRRSTELKAESLRLKASLYGSMEHAKTSHS